MADTLTLEGLVETINFECGAVAHAEASALDHAIAAGRALIAAKALVPGSWCDWIAVNLDISRATSQRYMRFARHEDEIRAGNATSMGHAERLIRADGLTTHGNGGSPSPHTVYVADHLLDLVRAGELSQTEAAREAGVSRSAIATRLQGRRVDKAACRRRQQRDRAARVALREKEQADRAKKVGGGLAELLSLIRRAAQLAEQEKAATNNKEIKAYLGTVYRAFRGQEDAINRAIGVAYGASDA